VQGRYHAVVWIDHYRARVFHFSAEDADRVVVHAERPLRDFKRGAKRAGHRPAENEGSLVDLAHAVADAEAILVVDPSSERPELVKRIERVHPAMRVKVEGVESADHRSDGVLLPHARRFYRAADRMSAAP